MYSIQGLENVFDVMVYTASALKEVGYSESEIEDYISSALREEHNLGIIKVSKEWLEECNNICSYNKDTWRDHYYSQLWHCKDEDDYLDDYSIKDYYDNMRSEYEVGSDEEAYEGFSSCSNYYWNSSEDDDLCGYTIKDYYDNMRSEYEVESSYHAFSEDEE
jgi:hypothetical protein